MKHSNGKETQTDTGLSPERLAELIAGYALDKKASDVVILDLREASAFTDFFVIVTARSDRQAKAIHDGVYESLKKEHALLPRRVEGLAQASWILMDYADVVMHAFTPQTRDYYRLEAVWGDMPKRDIDPASFSSLAAEA
jgi:ribosome-associated protein